MIARVTFEGIVRDGKKKSVLPDHVDIHVPPDGLEAAKELFNYWVSHSPGIKGASGVFHPLDDCSEVKIKGAEAFNG